MLPEAVSSLGGVARVPYAPSGSEQLGKAAAAAVADGAKLLVLVKHGAVSVGRNLTEAYERMELGELTAKTALMAAGGGSVAS